MTQTDEAAIREFYDDWIRATTVGDLDLARSRIAEGAVFLLPGMGTMDGETFAQGAAGGEPNPNIDYDLKTQINEIKVLGDHAYLWTEFSLTTTNKAKGATSKSAGHAISILQRGADGRWRVIREANTFAAVPE